MASCLPMSAMTVASWLMLPLWKCCASHRSRITEVGLALDAKKLMCLRSKGDERQRIMRDQKRQLCRERKRERKTFSADILWRCCGFCSSVNVSFCSASQHYIPTSSASWSWNQIQTSKCGPMCWPSVSQTEMVLKSPTFSFECIYLVSTKLLVFFFKK